MKLAGSRALVCAIVQMGLAAAISGAPAAAANDLQQDTVEIRPGAYYREDIFAPTDGGPWQATVLVINATGPVDVYVMRTTDLAIGYPNAAFTPIEGRENATYASVTWRPSDRRAAYSFVVDNLDNAHPADAVPSGAVHVRLVRSPPLHTNPQAAAALTAGTSLCAVLLALGAVGVAIYLKRRPRTDTDEVAAARVARIEVDVAVPQRPKGAWAAEAPDDLSEETGPLPTAKGARL